MKTKAPNIVQAKNKPNSKGAAIFKKMLDDKRAISAHLQKGGHISEIAEQYKIVKIVSIFGKG